MHVVARNLTYQYESSLQQSPNCEPSHVMLAGRAPLAFPHRPLIDKARKAVSFGSMAEEALVEDSERVDDEAIAEGETPEDEGSDDEIAEDESTEDEGRTPIGAES
jgi:hypothetical protein